MTIYYSRASRFAAAAIIAGVLACPLASSPHAQEQAPADQVAPAAKAPPRNAFGPRIQPPQGLPQGANPGQAPAASIVATHGDWKIQCESPPAGAAAQNGGPPPTQQCGMIQTARSEKEPKAMLTLVLVKEKQNNKIVPMMRVVAPIGVFLPTGVALEVDGAAVGRVPFTRCIRQVCFAFAAASGEMFDKLRKGKSANFIIYEGPGLPLPMKISLNGFAAAFGDLKEP